MISDKDKRSVRSRKPFANRFVGSQSNHDEKGAEKIRPSTGSGRTEYVKKR